MSQCECCDEQHVWHLMDPAFEFVCSPCVDDGQAVMCEYTGVYRIELACPGCGKGGAANYDDGDGPRYYCGGAPYCCP